MNECHLRLGGNPGQFQARGLQILAGKGDRQAFDVRRDIVASRA